jgi:hypothetical protein
VAGTKLRGVAKAPQYTPIGVSTIMFKVNNQVTSQTIVPETAFAVQKNHRAQKIH